MFKAKEKISFGQKKMDSGKGSRRKGAGGRKQAGCELAVIFVAWWCIAHAKPATAKALQEVCGNMSQDPKLFYILNCLDAS